MYVNEDSLLRMSFIKLGKVFSSVNGTDKEVLNSLNLVLDQLIISSLTSLAFGTIAIQLSCRLSSVFV